MHVVTPKYLKRYEVIFSQKDLIWFWTIHMVVTLASGTKKTRRCLSASFREIWFFGTQMIITYGQSAASAISHWERVRMRHTPFLCWHRGSCTDVWLLFYTPHIHIMKLFVNFPPWNATFPTLESFGAFECILCVLCDGMRLGSDSVNWNSSQPE